LSGNLRLVTKIKMKLKLEADGFVVLKQAENWLRAHTEINHQFRPLFMGEIPSHLPEALCWNVGDQHKIQKIDKVHLMSQAVRNLIGAHELAAHLTALTGASKIQLYSSHLFFKPVGSSDNGNIGWHTDTKNISNKKLNIFVACIPLGIIHPQSGNMKFLKGSHLWQGNSEFDFNDGACSSVSAQRQKLTQIMPEHYRWQEVFAYTKTEEFSIHHANIWHYSGPNRSPDPRMSLSISMHVQYDNSCYYLPDLTINPVIFNKNSSDDLHL